MGSALKRTLVVITYFIFWIFVYAVLCMFSGEEVLLLPHFRYAYTIDVILLSFIKILPALEIVIILLQFTVIVSQHSEQKLKKGSPLLMSLILNLFFMCIVASAFNMICSELIRPGLINAKNKKLVLSQKYYENINSYSDAVKNKDYKKAEQSLKVAFSIWDESAEVLSLQAQLASLQDNVMLRMDSADLAAPHAIIIPESLSPQEILDIAKSRMVMLDFYTAYNYANLVVKMTENDDELKAQGMELKNACMEKISSGASMHEILESQYQFEAKKNAYDALTQKDYEKAYYSFLHLHDNILSKTNKYDPDIERYLEIAKSNFLQQVFFIEEIEAIPAFNSGYNIRFKQKDLHATFNIGSFYFSNKKEGTAIYLSNLIYSQSLADGSHSFQIKIPYAKIIEKEVEGKKELFLLAEARSRYSLDKEIPSNNSILGYEKHFPINLKMTAQDFSLIVLAQQETSAMSIIDLHSFVPIANNYGFDSTVYIAEMSVRLADFFMFIIFTVLFAMVAFYLRPLHPAKCAFHFIFAGIVFPYLLFPFVEMTRQFFKFCFIILITAGIPFPVFSIMFLLFLMFLLLASRLYHLGYD